LTGFSKDSAAKTWMSERVSIASAKNGRSFVFAKKALRATIARAKGAR
jgi:hypothetical protein